MNRPEGTIRARKAHAEARNFNPAYTRALIGLGRPYAGNATPVRQWVKGEQLAFRLLFKLIVDRSLQPKGECMLRRFWVVTFAVLTLAAVHSVRQAWAGPEIGQMAPPLVVQTLSGGTFDLASDEGEIVVVDFWATGCALCRKEMAALDAFYRKYRSQGVALIAMSTDAPADRNAVRKAMHGYTYPAALVGDAKQNGFGVPGSLPVAYVIDSVGLVRAVLQSGQSTITVKSLSNIVSQLLPAG